MKHYLAIIFLLVLSSCETKQLSDLQLSLGQLEEKIAEVSQQRDLLQQQLENLNARDLTP